MALTKPTYEGDHKLTKLRQGVSQVAHGDLLPKHGPFETRKFGHFTHPEKREEWQDEEVEVHGEADCVYD